MAPMTRNGSSPAATRSDVQYFRDHRDTTTDGQETTAQAAAEVMSRYSTTPATDVA
jgi:hypothetical protein